MVAGAVKDHEVLGGFPQVRDEPADRILQMIVNPVTERNAVGEHSRAIGAFPPEKVGGEFFLVGLGAHEDIGVHPLELENLRQRAGMAERVRVVTDLRGAAEQLLEQSLAVKPLADQRFAARDVHIRLDPPPAHHAPIVPLPPVCGSLPASSDRFPLPTHRTERSWR